MAMREKRLYKPALAALRSGIQGAVSSVGKAFFCQGLTPI
jgi:hypothetical protein